MISTMLAPPLKSKQPISTLLSDILFLRAGTKRIREEAGASLVFKMRLTRSLAATKILLFKLTKSHLP